MGFKFSPLQFSGFSATGTSGGGGSASFKDSVPDYASLPLVGNSDGDVRVTLDTSFLYVWSATDTTWKTPNSVIGFAQEDFTLTGTDITNKYVTLSFAPSPANETSVDVIGGIKQDYSVDFTVSGSQLSWNSLGLEALLSSGDKLVITYFV